MQCVWRGLKWVKDISEPICKNFHVISRFKSYGVTNYTAIFKESNKDVRFGSIPKAVQTLEFNSANGYNKCKYRYIYVKVKCNIFRLLNSISVNV